MLLGDRIKQELPTFIVKANKAYREMAALHGTKNIWNVLPSDLVEFSKEAMTENDAVSIFIKSDRCTLGEEYATIAEEMGGSMQAFGMEFGDRNALNEAAREIMIGRDISKYGLLNRKASYIVNGEQRYGSIVIGIKIRETTQIESFVADPV
jgi:hypothetical protein